MDIFRSNVILICVSVCRSLSSINLNTFFEEVIASLYKAVIRFGNVIGLEDFK